MAANYCCWPQNHQQAYDGSTRTLTSELIFGAEHSKYCQVCNYGAIKQACPNFLDALPICSEDLQRNLTGSTWHCRAPHTDLQLCKQSCLRGGCCSSQDQKGRSWSKLLHLCSKYYQEQHFSRVATKLFRPIISCMRMCSCGTRAVFQHN